MELILFWALIWIATGVLSAMVASNKNRDTVGWFFIGFIFGPFGLLAAFIVEELPPQNEAGQAPAASSLNPASALATAPYAPPHRPCPYCAEDIKPEAIKCRHCGSEVNAIAARCSFCSQVVPKPGKPCAAVDEDKMRELAPSVRNLRCREELTKRGYIEVPSTSAPI